MSPYELRLQLLNAGYSPLPLIGKRPVHENWATRGPTNADEIRLWATSWPGASNTGILCRRCPALDIDILDSEAAEAVQQLVKDRFGEHGRVMPRIGQAPKRAIVFRTLLTGINSGSGLSGSTGWHNSVRARMYLHSTKPAEGEQPDNDLREIEFKKNNYGPKGHSIVLRYRGGLFLPEPEMSSLEKAAREQRIDDVFLALLRQMEGQHRPVSPSPHASNYAPKAFAKMEEGKAYTVRDYEAAMNRLFDRRLIHVGCSGKSSKPQKHLRSGPPPQEGE